MHNDLLLDHMRTLAKHVLDTKSKCSPEEERAALFIVNKFGLEGGVTETAQLSGRQPEAPDTLLHAEENHSRDKGTKISDRTYMPHLGVYGFSKHAIYDWQRDGSKLKLRYGSKDEDCYAISEGEILSMAEVIKARRELSEATERIKQGKPPFGRETHEGTDAEKSTQSGMHEYANWSRPERSQSSIILTIASGCRYLNGSMAEHQHYVGLSIKGPDGRIICEVALSPEQFAATITGRTEVPCTLDHYYSIGAGSLALTERVYNPESVLDRMKQRLHDSFASGDTKFAAIIEGLVKRSGKPMGKRDMEELIADLQRVYSGRADSAGFIITQAVEEGSALAESAMAKVLLAQPLGAVREVAASIGKSFGTVAKIEQAKE